MDTYNDTQRLDKGHVSRSTWTIRSPFIPSTKDGYLEDPPHIAEKWHIHLVCRQADLAVYTNDLPTDLPTDALSIEWQVRSRT